MPLRAALIAVTALSCGIAAASARAQEKPLTRAFSPGALESYRVELTLKSEVRGLSTDKIGVNTYVKPFVHQAEARISWTATRRIGSVSADGAAEIEESLAHVTADCRVNPGQDTANEELQASLAEICSHWNGARPLHYHETSTGLIHDLPREETVSLGEDAPVLLTLWLRRALRPSVILPAEPFHIGARRQTPTRPANFPWSDPRGSETIEWLDAPASQPGVTLHVVQELSGRTSPPRNLQAEGAASASSPPPDAQESFYADSLTTLSLLDGSVLSATRSATREKKQALPPVQGLPEPPQFGVKLTATVTIRRLP